MPFTDGCIRNPYTLVVRKVLGAASLSISCCLMLHGPKLTSCGIGPFTLDHFYVIKMQPGSIGSVASSVVSVLKSRTINRKTFTVGEY